MKAYRSLSLALGLAVIAMCATVAAHERKEVAGLNVLFGAEPEPALTGEMQFLRWRFTAQDKTPFTNLEEMKATVKRNGKTHGPFTGRVTAREPGVVATQHIFTSAGDYEATLTFKKAGDATLHSVTFAFKIADRKTLEIP